MDYSYSSGLSAGYAYANAARSNRDDWIRYAETLQARIKQLEAENAMLRGNVLISHASMQAVTQLSDDLATIVERAVPTAALADAAARKAARRNYLAGFLREKGYIYDPEKNEIVSGPDGLSMNR